jgi:iron complex transport system substrate-binding protein
VAGDVELLADSVGLEAEGQAVAAAMRDQLASLAATVRDLPHPRVFYEVDATVEIYGPADDSFLAEMVELAGGVPITSGSALSFAIPLERLVAEDPEIIVLGDAAYGTTPEIVAARPGWRDITAVRKGAIRPVPDDILVTRPGPRLPEGLRGLIEAIHPQALP